jgi:hypothetical protein
MLVIDLIEPAISGICGAKTGSAVELAADFSAEC